jgi:hypothetical protein
MLNGSLAPAKRALIFFGCMAAAVAGLTFGAGLQLPADQSSTTVAQLRGSAPPSETRLAATGRPERAAALRFAVPSPSRQAMAEGGPRVILR